MANSDGLGRMEALLKALGNPEKELDIIHVAGTNGKGSVCVMTASVLEQAGYSVGLYTSPHLETECERIQLWKCGDHHFIEQPVLDGLRDRVRAAASSLEDKNLTVFETYTAAAYLYYQQTKPDHVVLECGMGGLLDSTNTIESPRACVITQIGLDHTEELGSTIGEVARNKAGIIKEGCPVVSQTDDDAVREVIRSVAEEKDSEFTDVSSKMEEYAFLEPAMYGAYQKKNAVTAALAVKAAGAKVTREDLKEGIAKAVLPGRFEMLGEPGDFHKLGSRIRYFIIDGAHNPDAAEALAKEYTSFAKEHDIRRTIVIFGCMCDKNSERITEILAKRLRDCRFLAVSIDYGRAESAETVGSLISSAGGECTVCGDLKDAFETALKSDADAVLVAGSIYLAGDMRSMFKNAIEAVESDQVVL